MDDRQLTVLLGENGEDANSQLKNLLASKDLEVWECRDGIEAVRKAFLKDPDIIFLDVALPRLNGYQCARLLKNDFVMSNTPIIHIGSLKSPLEQYWSKICRGDAFLQKPVAEGELDEIIRWYLPQKRKKRQVLSPVRIIPDLEDRSILTLAINLLEQDLLRSNILNDINMIDISEVSVKDVVSSLMMILSSLYDFTLGTALLLYDQNAEFFFCPNKETKQDRYEEIKNLVFEHLQSQHGIYLKPTETTQTILQSIPGKGSAQKTENVFIHTKEHVPIRSVFAFENILLPDQTKDEQEILLLALELSHGVLEKKLYFQKSQELSIIDTATEGYTLAFLMEVLGREIENAKRKGYPLTLFTIVIFNYKDITRKISTRQKQHLIRDIYEFILKVTRKADIVARWENASFAFLLSHTPLEKARIVQERIINYLTKKLSNHLVSSIEPRIRSGISLFDPNRDLTSEIFFRSAVPDQDTLKSQPTNTQKGMNESNK